MKVTELNSLERSHKKDFEIWAKKENEEVFEKISDVVDSDKELFRGQKVNVKNGYGIEIGPFEIVGFCKPDRYGCCVYLDWDCYWLAKRVEDIIAY